MKRIILTGGGTAGHVNPNLALIPRLLSDGFEIHYIGAADSIEQKLIAEVPEVQFHAISCGKLRRYFDMKNFSDIFRVMKGMSQSKRLMREIKPDIVFSKGGFVSVPVVYGAHAHHIPVVVHESDVTPGLANKLSKPFADKVLCTFPDAAKLVGEKGVHTGTPLRSELFTGNRMRGLTRFGFKEGKPVLMVTGGSSGAQAINKALLDALPTLTESFQILHLCGAGNFDGALEGTPNYRQCEYLSSEMPDAYACADIVISRAGSNTLSELLALRKPALLIPYPKSASRGDQILNAKSFFAHGLCHVLYQEDMTGDTLAAAVIKLYHERGTLYEAMDKEPSTDGLGNVLREIYKCLER